MVGVCEVVSGRLGGEGEECGGVGGGGEWCAWAEAWNGECRAAGETQRVTQAGLPYTSGIAWGQAPALVNRYACAYSLACSRPLRGARTGPRVLYQFHYLQRWTARARCDGLTIGERWPSVRVHPWGWEWCA